MESLYIPGQVGSFPTPVVSFDLERSVLVLAGESHPEDAATFYAPLILWLDALIESPPRGLLFEIRLTFFSPSTRPQLLAMLRRLRLWSARGAEVTVQWQVDDDDDDMVDTAADFATMSGLPIRIVRARPPRPSVGSAF